MYDVS